MSLNPNLELRSTKDGSHTVYIKELDEHYHSLFGAVTESKHVFIDAGLKFSTGNQINILEMGFGTGLNAILTLTSTIGSGRNIHYTGYEKHPLEKEIFSSLNYVSFLEEEHAQYFNLLHEVPWNKEAAIIEEFRLLKIEDDICSLDIQNKFDLVYFDAFAPDKQPELWSTEIFNRIFLSMKPGAILTTYSSKGQIRRNLQEAGFLVEKLPGPPGKRDMTRALKR